MTTIKLPFPPKHGDLYTGRNGNRKTDRYRTWISAARWNLDDIGLPAMKGQVSVCLLFGRARGKGHPLIGMEEPIIDLLAERGILSKKSIGRISMAWSSATQECMAIITPIAEQPMLAAE